MGFFHDLEASLLKKVSGFLFFFFPSLGAFILFGSDLYQLFLQVKSNVSVIEFHKGSFFDLGIGLGFGVFTYMYLQEVILQRAVTPKVTKWMTRGLISSVFIMMLFPQIAHYSLEHILEKQGYMICNLDSYQWRIYRTFYYVSEVDACTNLIESK